MKSYKSAAISAAVGFQLGSNSNQDYSAIIAIINSMSGGSDITYESALSTLVVQYKASGEGDIQAMLTSWSNRISITD